jgi:hypothetical protein
MKLLYLSIAFLFFATISVNAQGLSGTVTEAGNNNRLENVFVRDITNKQVALTDKNGKFDIRAEVNHTLIFTLPGYVPDTLFLADDKPKHVELKVQGITLNTVTIAENAAPFDPEKEYPEVYRNSEFALSFSRIFGKQARDARRLKRYFKKEVERRQVDAIFTRSLVSSIVPLKGRDLDNFISLYRPSLAFAKGSTHESIVVYINDSYKQYKALPADKRGMQSLNGN